MGRHRRHRRRRRELNALRWALALIAAVAGGISLVAAEPSPGVGAGVPPAPVVLTATVPTRAAAAPTRVAANPVAVELPAIDVRSSLAELGVDAAGVLVPPADFAQAGWYAAGPAPGDVGPAVIAGHVDSRSGPAVFFRLEELLPGDEVLIERADGLLLRYTVTRVAQYPKNAFATGEVYGPTTGSELRLITCGGNFDRSRRSYTDNIVVYARPTDLS